MGKTLTARPLFIIKEYFEITTALIRNPVGFLSGRPKATLMLNLHELSLSLMVSSPVDSKKLIVHIQ